MPEIVVTATRSYQDGADIPAAVGVVSGRQIREAGPLLNLSESLVRVPGVSARNRHNLAQDLQINSRGFGARATFGVRGVRLYEDGIPLTMPDGQGQSSSFALSAAQRIEVLRGAASTLYGNASGGVIQLFTQEPSSVPEVSAGYAVSRDGFSMASMKVAERRENLSYVINASKSHTKGFRDHSQADRGQLHAKLQWSLSSDTTLTVVGSYLAVPMAEDPMGLNAAQLAANPSGVEPAALQFNTRKAIYNNHLGGIYERQIGRDTLRVMVYGGTRQALQYQSISRAAQTAGPNGGAGHPGGVIDLDRRFIGLDAHYVAQTDLLARPLTLTGGVSVDGMAEHRQGMQNFDASTGQLGVQGALRRNENNLVYNNDQYLLAQWRLSPQWLSSLGVRHSNVKFKSSDNYVVAGNGDDSGRMSFSATTPTASVMWRAAPALHVYATAGRSFETPTLNEVAYNSNAGSMTGWNTRLKASQGHHVELGAKAGMGTTLQGTLALYRVDTDDEIAVLVNSGGRATYQNVGHTKRTGLEASIQWRMTSAWSANANAAWTQATYADPFSSTSTGVTMTVPQGRALPGVARRTAFAELIWRPAPMGWHAGLEWRHSGRIWANDINDEFAPSSQLWAMRAGWRQTYGQWLVTALARIDNANNAHTVGSVIVNEGSRRYFEPAPGRSATLATYVTRKF